MKLSAKAFHCNNQIYDIHHISQNIGPIKGSSDEIDELKNSLGELSDQLDAFGLQIEELSTDVESQNEKINEDV